MTLPNSQQFQPPSLDITTINNAEKKIFTQKVFLTFPFTRTKFTIMPLFIKTSLFCLAIITSSCTTTNSGRNTVNTTDCNTKVTVIKYEVDGCNLMLQKENGDKWLIFENKTGKEYGEGDVLKIGYTVISDAMSSCMAEQASMALTCLEVIKKGNVKKEETGRPMPLPCTSSSNPMEIDWLKKIIEEQQPTRILRYGFRGAAAYRVDHSKGILLFDCQGNELCQEVEGDCLAKFRSEFEGSKLIYMSEGRED